MGSFDYLTGLGSVFIYCLYIIPTFFFFFLDSLEWRCRGSSGSSHAGDRRGRGGQIWSQREWPSAWGRRAYGGDERPIGQEVETHDMLAAAQHTHLMSPRTSFILLQEILDLFICLFVCCLLIFNHSAVTCSLLCLLFVLQIILTVMLYGWI